MMDKSKAFIAMVIGGLFLTILFMWQMVSPKNKVVPAKPTIKYKINSSFKIPKSASSAKAAYKISTNEPKNLKFLLDPRKHVFKNQEDFETWAAKQLSSKFEEDNSYKSHYSFLSSFRTYLKTQYPENWHTIQDKILQIAIPEQFNHIKKVYDKIDQYDKWFNSNHNLLATMTLSGIKSTLWQKRKDLFGEDATKIWSIDSKNDLLQDIIAIFNDASHISIEEKLQVFKNLWADLPTNNNSNTLNQIRKYHMAFMNLDSVQLELAQMNVARRAEKLLLIRKAMGYDDTKIKEMMNLDAYENQQWDKGRRYMSERDELIKQFTGSEREEQLRLLRQRYFKHEANVIATEEASNYFRFRQKRVYGHN
ncbi:MAG: hypothetical protein PVI90_02025 [Desulfobacteraceae bacterium]|jgi:hypothetical protein